MSETGRGGCSASRPVALPGERSSNPLIRDSVSGRGDQKNKILFPNENPTLRLSSPVTDTIVISSLIAVPLVFCTDHYVFPSRKDGRKEGRIEVTRRRSRRHKQLLDDHKEKKRVLGTERESTRSL